MTRWPRLVALSLGVWGLGCGGRVVPGLANAPSMNRTTADDSVHDVVANGSDVCGRGVGRSPLRGHLPPCAAMTRSATDADWARPGSQQTEGEGALVLPWLEHFYVGWPCPRARPRAASAKAFTMASLSVDPPPSSCAVP